MVFRLSSSGRMRIPSVLYYKYTNFTASWPIDSVVTGEGALLLQVLSEADISEKIIMALPAGSPQIIIAELFDKTWMFPISNGV